MFLTDVKALLNHCAPIMLNKFINWRYNFSFNFMYDCRVADIILYFIWGNFVFTIMFILKVTIRNEFVIVQRI